MRYNKSPILEVPEPKPSLKERAEKIGIRLAIWLSLPLIGGAAAWISSDAAGLFTMAYLYLRHFMPLFWLGIAFTGYGQNPSREEVEKCTYNYPATYFDKWQLLLFPAQCNAYQFSSSKEKFLRSGFRIWEGRLASLLCAFALMGDLLDDFDEDWGMPIRYREIILQFGHSAFVSALSGMFLLAAGRTICAWIFLPLAIAQSATLVLFFLYNRYRMPQIQLDGD